MSNSHGKYDCLINRKSDTEEEEMNNETSRQENGYNSQKGYKITVFYVGQKRHQTEGFFWPFDDNLVLNAHSVVER